MSVRRIVDEAFPGAAGPARLTQLGLLVLILVLEDDPDPPTLTRLAALAGLRQSTVRRHLEALVAQGLVERTKLTPNPGRGRTLRIAVKETGAAGRLVETMLRDTARARRRPGACAPH